MGNCCRSPAAVAREDVKSNYSANHDFNRIESGKKPPISVYDDAFKEAIEDIYMVDKSQEEVIGDFLSNEEVEDIKEMFKKIDSDNDGIVSIQELKIGLQKFRSQLEDNEVQVDTNGKGIRVPTGFMILFPEFQQR